MITTLERAALASPCFPSVPVQPASQPLWVRDRPIFQPLILSEACCYPLPPVQNLFLPNSHTLYKTEQHLEVPEAKQSKHEVES